MVDLPFINISLFLGYSKTAGAEDPQMAGPSVHILNLVIEQHYRPATHHRHQAFQIYYKVSFFCIAEVLSL